MTEKLSLYFNRSEFACKCGCGFDTVDTELLNCLDTLRTFTGKIRITSGCRCPKHNTLVGGREKSYHMWGRAVDIQVEGLLPANVYELLDNLYPGSYGLMEYKNFVHFDTRTGKGYRFPRSG